MSYNTFFFSFLKVKTTFLVNNTESLQCWFIQWGDHFATCNSHCFISAWNINWNPKAFSGCHYMSSPAAKTLTPANAVLMHIKLQESTYYKRLTFVLIYWIVSATESLKLDPLTSSFLSLLTLAGQAWQVDLQQSSLIMWNKSIC